MDAQAKALRSAIQAKTEVFEKVGAEEGAVEKADALLGMGMGSCMACEEKVWVQCLVERSHLLLN